MPSRLPKRKLASSQTRSSNRQTCPPPNLKNSDITRFTRSSKPHVDPLDIAPQQSNRKRAASVDYETPEESCPSKKLKSSDHTSPNITPTKQSCLQQPCALPTPARTPSSHLAIDSSVSVTPTKATNSQIPSTPPLTPKTSQPDDAWSDPAEDELPDQLNDLVSLNAAFLKTLSLHIAHDGSTSPIPVASLTPSISKNWKKGNVTLPDIRRILGILSLKSTDSPTVGFDIDIYDYGRGAVCLEINTRPSSSMAPLRPIHEPNLSKLFLSNLQRLWREFRSPVVEKTALLLSDISDFVQTLPLMPVLKATSKSSTSNAARSRPKKGANETSIGQKRLTDLFAVRKPASTAQDESLQSTAVTPAKTADSVSSKPSLESRKSSLADRLRQKAQDKAASCTPSAAESARIAAIQRIPEIVGILSADAFRSNQPIHNPESNEHISTAPDVQTQRKTYNLSSLILKIQESAKSILSRAEIQLCLEELSGKGIAGENFIKIVSIGGRNGDGDASIIGVVVDVSKRVALAEISYRVAQLQKQ